MASKKKRVELAVTPASFADVYTKLGRKPDLIPVNQSTYDGTLTFKTMISKNPSVEMVVMLKPDGTWTAATAHIVSIP